MVMSRLTNIELDNLKPRDKVYKVNDRNGLYVLVGTSGTKTFQFRYQVYSNGKERDGWYTIGKYPKITLEQARAELQVLRLDVARGLDVQENKLDRRKLALTPKGKTTFKKVATDWLEHRKTRVGQNTWDKDWSRLERFILPNFATTDVKDILAKDLLDQMNKVAEINGRETAQRTMNQVGSVLKYAMRLGYVKHNVANGMTEYLPKPVITSHKAILDTTKLGEFVYVIEIILTMKSAFLLFRINNLKRKLFRKKIDIVQSLDFLWKTKNNVFQENISEKRRQITKGVSLTDQKKMR